jgi:hypothetical protein
MSNATADLQTKLAAARTMQAAAKANPEAAALAALEAQEAEATSKEDIVFQQYKASRSSARIVTDKGIRITFAGFELLTHDPAVIEYLDAQIAIHGLPGITKGEALTLNDRNPMATMERKLRIQIKKELEEEAAARARGEFKDMGSTEGAPKMKVLTSNQTAS